MSIVAFGLLIAVLLALYAGLYYFVEIIWLNDDLKTHFGLYATRQSGCEYRVGSIYKLDNGTWQFLSNSGIEQAGIYDVAKKLDEINS